MNEKLAPVSAAQRVETIDILRGFAILGILVVNVLYMFDTWFAAHLTESTTVADRLAYFLTNTFFVSKFFTLFSFLFGLGLYIQMNRAEAKGRRFLPVYLRRMVVLALFGFAHAALFWVGDILFLYAILGVIAAVAFRKASPRALLIWAVVLIAIPLLFITLATGAIEFARLAPPESGTMEGIEASFAESRAMLDGFDAEARRIYAGGTWSEITAHRVREFGTLLFSSNLFMAPSVLAMFLIGLRAGKKGWFRLGTTASDSDKSREGQAGDGRDRDGERQEAGDDQRRERFRRILRRALPPGLALNLYVGLSGFELNRLGMEVLAWRDAVAVTALGVGSVLLSLSYVAMIAVLAENPRGHRILAPLAPVGRMALTNYILHSVVMSTLAYGYGFALFGRVPVWAGFLMAFALYAIQIPFSRWWFGRFRFGPLEWLWRVLTYGAVPSPAPRQA